jgi:hypothetical protein
MLGLPNYLDRDPVKQANGTWQLAEIYNTYYAPGFWTALAALARAHGLGTQQLRFWSQEQRGYASAVGLDLALDHRDGYPYERRNEGKNYSGLVLLASAEATDKATEDVNGCIRTLFQDENLQSFVRNLCDVVGDLHDNVWSHGKSTGYSMAQKWRKTGTDDYYLEFALADSGLGFLRELQRVGLKEANSHEAAIKWCIVKGNSSKRVKPIDEWEQRLPADVSGNPIKGIGKPRESDYHHLGLGLWKLVQLVTTWAGQLWLASGTHRLYVPPNGQQAYYANKVDWQGVALACRFDTGLIRQRLPRPVDEVTRELAEFLRGNDGKRN